MSRFSSQIFPAKTKAVLVFIIAAVLLTPFFGGCRPREGVEFVSEIDEPAYRRGKQLLREGRRAEALSAFLSVIEKRDGEAPESHLEAGELFRAHLQDPISAIYHYRKFLEYAPSSPQAGHVRQLIETAIRDFARALPAQPFEEHHERLDLLETIERLKQENEQLKHAIASARQERDRFAASIQRQAVDADQPRPRATVTERSQPPTVVQENARQDAAARPPRTYTVVAGDTLTHISAQVYGTRARWRDIFEANRDILPNENSLRIGMVLRIPE